MNTFTAKDFSKWYPLWQQLVNGWHLSDSDKNELLQLNHRLMEICHDIHNKNMLGQL